jgi:hypothetical protein
MPIITKWNNLSDWRHADISDTGILSNVSEPSTCILSASSWGMKGKLPGARHSWASVFNGTSWKTYEITDLETVEIQRANVLYAKYTDTQLKQLIVSDRNPGTLWFGNKPRIDYITNYLDINADSYPMNYNIDLIINNCNTFTSYLAWKHNLNFNPYYVGFKNKKFWNKILKIDTN